MLKNMTIRNKITLWFSLSLILLVLVTYFIVSYVSKNVMIKNLQDNLVETVLHNMRGLEFIDSEDNLQIGQTSLAYNDGFIVIDEDFLDIVNGVYTALYNQDNKMIYGEDPIAKQSFVVDFTNDQIKELSIDGTKHYIYDIDVSETGYEGLWMRGIVPETSGLVYAGDIRSTAMIVLPLMAILSIIGGYIIVNRSLKPIKDVTNAASSIEASGDLRQRVDVGNGKDEAHELAYTFNSMLNRLEDSFERQKQFTSDASHELRTPTSVILAQSDFYLEEERSTEEYVKALTVINRQGQKMKELINSMLDISRLEIKPENYVKEKLNLSNTVGEAVQGLDKIDHDGITLDVSIGNSIYIEGNKELISRLVINLLTNAYKYGKTNGNIWLNLTHSQGRAILSVKDDGIGIANSDKNKIFRRFYQADSSRRNTGTGLGLSMVKEIADYHNAIIKVESKLGEGSEFIVSFKLI